MVVGSGWGCTTKPAPTPPVDPTTPPATTDTGLGTVAPDTDAPSTDTADSGWHPPDPDAGDTPADARVLPDPSPALTISDTIDPPGDVDWFALDLHAGDTVWLAALAGLRSPPSPLVPRLELRDEAGTTLHIVRGMPLDIADHDSALAFEAPATARYFLGVQATSPTTTSLAPDPTLGGPDHAFSLRVERAEPFEAEPTNDSAADLTAWLAEDGTYAYRGDPFIAGWPLFSFRADHTADTDLFPWTVRGEHADGSAADWELWSWSPWPGCAPTSSWRVISGSPDDPAAPVLGTGHTRTLDTDPLWRLARHNLPAIPDVGLLVEAAPGEMWLEVIHDADAPTVGSACTGILAGWYTDNIARYAHLPATDGVRQATTHPTDAGPTTLVWGWLDVDDTHALHIPVDPDHPVAHVILQAERVGHPVDITLTTHLDDTLARTTLGNPYDRSADPEQWNLHTTGHASLGLTLHAAAGTGHYLLQVVQAAEEAP